MSQSAMRKPLRKVLPGLFCLAVTLSSCSSSKPAMPQASTALQTETRYQEATELIARKKYDNAIVVLESLLFSTRATSLEDDVLYSLADSYYQDKQYLLAADMYRRLLQQTPDSPFARNAQFKLAKSYDKLSPFYELDQENTAKAIYEFATYLDEYPVDDIAQAQRDVELYTGLLNVNPANASYKASLDEAQARLSDDAPAKYSQAAIPRLRNKLAQNRYSIARQYMRLKEYRAADIYFDVILSQFPDTEFAQPALLGKIESNIEGGKGFEALQSIELYQQRYPGENKEVDDAYKRLIKHFAEAGSIKLK